MNPELRKNIWLELSGARVGTLLLVVVLASFILANAKSPAGVFYDFGATMLSIAAIFGSSKIVKSIASEISDNTWDFQRMSSATAWELTIGKLVGAPIFFILIGTIGLVMLVVAAVLGDVLPVSVLVLSVPSMICGVAILYSLGLAKGLESAAADRSRRRTKMGDGMFLMVPILAVGMVGTGLGSQRTVIPWSATALSWWGIEFKQLQFVLFSAILFTFWSVLGAYRMMRVELQHRATPLVWAAFLLFLWLYLPPLLTKVLGGQSGYDSYVVIGITGMIVGGSALYYGLLTESKDIIGFKKLDVHLKAGEFRRALQYLPRWAVSLGVFAIGTVCVVVSTSLALHALAVFFFALRDSAAILSFHVASPGHRRNFMGAVTYLSLTYFLFPVALAMANARQATALLHPFVAGGEYHVTSFVGSTLGALVAVAILVSLWKQRA